VTLPGAYRVRCALALLCVLCAIPLSHADLTLSDDAGNPIDLAQPAQRIITIAPNLAEMAYAAGAGRWLIASVRGTDYPPAASALPLVGDAAGLDFERIFRLRPDLVLAWGSGNRQVDLDRLVRKGIVVFIFEARSLSDIPRQLRLIGQLAGSEPAAEMAAARFENALARLRATYSEACPVDVFVEIWHQPVFTVGPSHALSDALQVCGARNVLRDYPLLAGPVPLEDVLIARADAILSVTGEVQADAQKRWDKQLPDSNHRQTPVISVSPELLVRSGPRMLDGTRLLCTRLAPLRASACNYNPPNR
jgi:iron complex transport system substrate-binding protein